MSERPAPPTAARINHVDHRKERKVTARQADGREREGEGKGGERENKEKKAKINCLGRGEKRPQERGQRSDVAYVIRGSAEFRSFVPVMCGNV
jgi:hypothetical protein